MSRSIPPFSSTVRDRNGMFASTPIVSAAVSPNSAEGRADYRRLRNQRIRSRIRKRTLSILSLFARLGYFNEFSGLRCTRGKTSVVFWHAAERCGFSNRVTVVFSVIGRNTRPLRLPPSFSRPYFLLLAFV